MSLIYHDPGIGDAVEIIQMFVNGIWTDPRDCVCEATLKRWEQEILEKHWSDAADREHSAREAHYDSLREERLLESAK